MKGLLSASYVSSILVFSARALWGLSDVFHALNQCFCAAELYKGRVNLEIELCNFLLKCS